MGAVSVVALLRAADTWLNRLYLLCGYIAAAFLIVLAGLVLLSIVTRPLAKMNAWLDYPFSATAFHISGLNDYSGYALAASTFLALAYTFVEGGHIRVAILRSNLRGKAKLALEFWCFAIASFFSCYLAWFLTKMTYISWDFEEKAEGAHATLLWIPQSVMAAGSIIVAIAVVHSFIKLLITRDVDSVNKTPDNQLME